MKPDFVAVRSVPAADRDLEAAADYLGVYLARPRAGFTMNKAGLLMRSLSALDPDFHAGAHRCVSDDRETLILPSSRRCVKSPHCRPRDSRCSRVTHNA